MNSDVTINVTVTQGGTIDADLEGATQINTTVEDGGQIEATVYGGGTGPQGEQGEQGIQGATGATGATGAGVPNGGTIGQVLAKLSGTDQDTAWHTPVKADVGLSNVDNTSDANKPVSTAQQTALDAKQPLDSDLTAIAALSPSNDDVIQRKAGAWTNRTPAQLKTDLSLTKSDIGLSNVDNTSDANKPVSTAQQTALDAKVTGPGSVTDDLPAIFDGTTGKLIKSKTYAAFKTLLALVKGDVGLGNVDNTADSAKSVASAAILTTARNIDGQSFDGSGNITVIAPGTHAATGKTTPVDADELPLVDSAASNVLKKLTWANLKATAKTYFDTLYQPLNAALTSISGLTPTNDDVIQRKAGAWTNRTMAQLIADLGALATTFQPLDSDLTTIAGLTATTDNFMQSKSSAWASRTPTQVTADLIAFVGDSGAGGTKGLVPAPATGDASKALFGDGTFKTIPGGGDALTSNPLSQFAATTSLQLKGVMSDETGSGALVFATSPALVTPDLGTPSAATLTNATGLPVAGITPSTSTALGVGTIELGHATDTTLSRASAGRLAVEGTGIAKATDGLDYFAVSTSNTIGVGNIELGHASDTTISRASAGDIQVEGNRIFRVGGADVPVADGGTGSSTAAAAALALSVIPADGWIDANTTWSYASGAGGVEGTFTISGDLTAILFAGMKIKMTQTTVKYFIITKVAHAAGTTTVTVYGGTDYSLANAAITAPYYSVARCPAGFPMSPLKWTVTLTNTGNTTANPGAAGTVVNPGSLSLSIPTGVWDVSMSASLVCQNSTAAIPAPYGGLSTANNSFSDNELVSDWINRDSSTSTYQSGIFIRKQISLAAATTYYLVATAQIKSGTLTVGFVGTRQTTVVKAICAYL